jgi:hypothetical protein
MLQGVFLGTHGGMMDCSSGSFTSMVLCALQIGEWRGMLS